MLAYEERTGAGANWNTNTGKLGCCPKAGTFFKMRNPLEDVIQSILQDERFDDFIQENAGTEASNVMSSVLGRLKSIDEEFKRSSRRRKKASRRNLGKT